MKRYRCSLAGALLASSIATAAWAQTPQPFPKPGDPARPSTPPQQQPPPGAKIPPIAQPAIPPTDAPTGEPTERMLGVPIYPGSQFIASYDAGRGQRYFLFGTAAEFAQIVAYYRTTLKQRGELVYEAPPIHMFDVGRFREETMAFPPGVTVKDYTWGGSDGYINPKPGGQPPRFKTIIQIVPAPAGASSGK
jgi:hypothetical protein